MNSCCIYTGVCGVECSGKDTEVDINSCKVAREIDKLIDRIQNLKREKEKYYQMTLDDEIQINELFRENAKLKEKLDDIEYIISYCAINRKSCYFCKFDKECEGQNKDLILKIMRGEE